MNKMKIWGMCYIRLKFPLPRYLLILLLIRNVSLVPVKTAQLPSNEFHEDESKLVEIKLPAKITNMDDIIAWARNAMRSMASRIDITLATVDEANDENSDNNEERDSVISSSRESRKPVTTDGALVTTYASLFGNENTFRSPSQSVLIGDVLQRDDNRPIDLSKRDNKNIVRGVLPRGNVNAYLPLLLDESEISKYREEALKKYYLESELAKREKNKNDSEEKIVGKYSEKNVQRTSQIGNDATKKSLTKNSKDEKKVSPVISVPFEAVVTITRENLPERNRLSYTETRDPPDEFPPYFERDYRRDESTQKSETDRPKKIKDSGKKRQIAALGDILRTLGLTKKLTNTRINKFNASLSIKPKKPSEQFTPPLQIKYEDQSQRQRRNETSQRQEFDDDDDEEEEGGSLGSIADLLPLVLPIIEDIIDPNTETDLGEVLSAALPLVQGLSDPNDPDAPDIIGMIGPILTNILGGPDGKGSDVAAILGPLITLIAPLIGPVLGPLVGPLLTASSNPPQGEGSSLATLITAVVGPLVQPTDASGMSPLSVLTAGIIAALSKELKPGLPGGLDVGALVGAILSGVIAGTSAGLSGSSSGSSSDPNSNQSYGPYPAGPAQAGSVNGGPNTGYQLQASQQQQRPIHAPGNIVEHQRIVHQTTLRPYFGQPQRIPSGPQPGPLSTTYIQQVHPTGPLQAGTGTNGGSSYLPYGTNAAPANTVNPIGLIGAAIKDVLGAGVQVVSSVINVVFGIIGGSSSSSSEEPRPVYGPPAPYGRR